jgi:hypothetical protein
MENEGTETSPALLLNGDFFTGAVLASTLSKLVLRYNQSGADTQQAHALRAEVRAKRSAFRDTTDLPIRRC